MLDEFPLQQCIVWVGFMTPDQLGVDFSWFPPMSWDLAAQVIMQHVPVQKVVEKQVLVLFCGVLFWVHLTGAGYWRVKLCDFY